MNLLVINYGLAVHPIRAHRLEQDRELSSWRQWRQSTRRDMRRLKEDALEWLGSLELWRGDIHMIEGERGVIDEMPWLSESRSFNRRGIYRCHLVQMSYVRECVPVLEIEYQI